MAITAPKCRAWGFLLSEANGNRSRENGTLLAGESVVAGEVLGAVTAGAATSAAKSGGNTGNGTITAAPTKLAGAQAGVYQVRATGGAFDGAIAAAAGNTGNGTAAMNVTETAAGVVAGVYRAVCIEPAADGGTFAVYDPAGVYIGDATVGVLFDGVVKFTISDGGTDFAAGDAFNITVTATIPADGGVFSVTAPNGAALPNATVGVAYATQLAFTIADGSTDFIVGDGFDITVAAGADKLRAFTAAAVDGSSSAVAIAGDSVDATDADQMIAYIARDAEVNEKCLTYPSGQLAAVTAALEAAGIRVRS